MMKKRIFELIKTLIKWLIRLFPIYLLVGLLLEYINCVLASNNLLFNNNNNNNGIDGDDVEIVLELQTCPLIEINAYRKSTLTSIVSNYLSNLNECIDLIKRVIDRYLLMQQQHNDGGLFTYSDGGDLYCIKWSFDFKLMTLTSTIYFIWISIGFSYLISIVFLAINDFYSLNVF